jgi:hypothetical protein
LTTVDLKRSVGVIGLYVLIAINKLSAFSSQRSATAQIFSFTSAQLFLIAES